MRVPFVCHTEKKSEGGGGLARRRTVLNTHLVHAASGTRVSGASRALAARGRVLSRGGGTSREGSTARGPRLLVGCWADCARPA
jgi:hypothetical protein